MKPFSLPTAFLTQLEEFTRGYFLVTINEKGEFECFENVDSPVAKMGITKFIQTLLDIQDQKMVNNELDKDMEFGEDDDTHDDVPH